VEIDRNILMKYARLAAIDQLKAEYRQKGYRVASPTKAREFGADLVVRKAGETIAITVKAEEWSQDRLRAFIRNRNKAVHELGASFRLVLVSLPEETDIIIEDLDSILAELLPERFNDVFDKLATHYWIEEITDAKYALLHVERADITAQGTATVTLGLQYGSDGDYRRGQGVRFTESFPFHFHIVLHRDFSLKEVKALDLAVPLDPD